MELNRKPEKQRPPLDEFLIRRKAHPSLKSLALSPFHSQRPQVIILLLILLKLLSNRIPQKSQSGPSRGRPFLSFLRFRKIQNSRSSLYFSPDLFPITPLAIK